MSAFRCALCNIELQLKPNSVWQKYCEKCRKIVRKETYRKHYRKMRQNAEWVKKINERAKVSKIDKRAHSAAPRFGKGINLIQTTVKCSLCDREIYPTSNAQKYCQFCKKAVKAQSDARWRNSQRDYKRKKDREYYQKLRQNPEWIKKNNARSAFLRKARLMANSESLEKAREQYRRASKRRKERGNVYERRYALLIKANPDLMLKRREQARLRWHRRKLIDPLYVEAKNAKKRELWKRIKQDPEWVERYRKYYREKVKERLKSDIRFRLSRYISSRIAESLKTKGIFKRKKHWEDLVGYSVDELKKHLETQFQVGMTWENYGKWHIDHIMPINFFKFKSYTDSQFKQCWALENLRPLWASDNLKKGRKFQIRPVTQ